MCIATISFRKLWDKLEEVIYIKYGLLQILKGTFYIMLLLLILSNMLSYKMYYIADTLIMALITKNILFGSNKLKSIRYNSQNRNKFDNKILIVGNIASLVGLTISLIFNVSINAAFIFITAGIVIEAVFNYKVFNGGDYIELDSRK